MLSIGLERRYLGTLTRCILISWAWLSAVSVFAASEFPELTIEIGAEHPVFVFDASGIIDPDPVLHAGKIIDAWTALPDELKSFSVLVVTAPDVSSDARFQHVVTAMERLREAAIPIALPVLDDSLPAYSISQLESILRDNTNVKGLLAGGLIFDDYPRPAPELAAEPILQWLNSLIELSARYGRLSILGLEELGAARLMSNAGSASLFQMITTCRDYVIPLSIMRGPHTVGNSSAIMGMWLEEAVSHWGIGATSDWYRDARFIQPGVFGVTTSAVQMPSTLYRAMTFNGAMTGATVYAFLNGDDLWFGGNRVCWDTAIYPALQELMTRGIIARKEYVQKKVHVAYQLGSAVTPLDFHLNLRDIDAVLDEGNLIHGGYGMERPHQVSELILNTGRHYWIPFLSPHASQEVLAKFARVVQPGAISSAAEWTQVLDQHFQPDASGTAFVCEIGRGIFIMHTLENLYQEQTFRLPSAPAPVTGIEVSRQADGVVVTWPFREGDVAYKVYKRVAEAEQHYTLLASDLEERRYLDAAAAPGETIGYTVTALTGEKAPYEGRVNYGDFIALSVVESRIEEEAFVSALLSYGKSRPLELPEDTRPKAQTWWPNLEGLDAEQALLAQTIAARIEAWDAAFASENLTAVLDVYAPDYTDPEGWQVQYVRRAYQWFFERYAHCAMERQIRKWDFSNYAATGQIGVFLYCRLNGVAVSDTLGRLADIPVCFPRSEIPEVRITFIERDGAWRILTTNPALPSQKEILSYSTGPYDRFTEGPDVFKE